MDRKVFFRILPLVAGCTGLLAGLSYLAWQDGADAGLAALLLALLLFSGAAGLIAFWQPERSLRLKSQERYRAFLRATPDMLFLMDADGRYIDIYVRDPRELFIPYPAARGNRNEDFIPADAARREREAIRTTLESGRLQTYEYSLDWPDGPRYYEARAVPAGDSEVLISVRDVSRRVLTEHTLRLHEETLRRYDFIVNTSQEWMTLINRQYVYEAANEAYCRMHQRERGEIVGTSVESVWGTEQFYSVIKPNFDRCFAGETVNYHTPLTLASGLERYFEVTYYPYRADGEAVTHVVVVSRDVTEQKHAEDQLRHDALHDSLTSLPNRALFLDRLERAVVRLQRNSDTLFAVLFMDLDRFKMINDSMGHLMGDKLLMDAARRIKSCVREADTVARLGGDEFTVLLDGILSEADAERVAARIRLELAKPFQLDREEIFITVSIGIALSNAGYEEYDDMLRDADAALYSAKRNGGNRHTIFHRSLHDSVVSRLQTEGQIRRATAGGEFEVFYMPIVNLANERVSQMEALIRWRHPERGIVGPMEFIPVAEETGLIMEIGAFVLEESAAQVRRWREAGYDDLKISVNCSARQFQDPNFVRGIERVLRERSPGDQAIVLELTESALLGHEAESRDILGRLRELGVLLAIDDFGTGYSSLGYLKRLPFDELKIDKSFVDDTMSSRGRSTAILAAIIRMAQTLGLKVVAEGVETESQVKFFREEGCDMLQGYYYSPPVAVDQATRLLERGLAAKGGSG